MPNGFPGSGKGNEDDMTQLSKMIGLCSVSDQPTCGYEGSHAKTPFGWIRCVEGNPIMSHSSVLVFDKSSIFKKIKKKVLYIGTNDTRAQLIHKSLARKKLKLNQNEKIILFATFNLSSFIKGGHLLVKALEYLSKDMISKKENITLLTLGKKNQFFLKVKNIKWIHIETTKSNKQLNEIFRASDLMVCPSLFCFGPHIVEEAFLNKLPVVSFDGGSSQDFIVNGKNGYLVKKYNIKKFSEAIKKIISRKQFRFDEILYKQIKENCNSKNEAKKLINFCN